jgi:uncharacterized protein YbjQ (UPF0145 family)
VIIVFLLRIAFFLSCTGYFNMLVYKLNSFEKARSWRNSKLSEKQSILVVTTPTVAGYEIVKVLGAVSGITVRTRGVGGKFIAGIEGMFGGEVTSYTSECEKARNESLQRLIENATKLGANAVIGADFETSDILQGTATTFSAYGIAVIIKPVERTQ